MKTLLKILKNLLETHPYRELIINIIILAITLALVSISHIIFSNITGLRENLTLTLQVATNFVAGIPIIYYVHNKLYEIAFPDFTLIGKNIKQE